MHTIEAFIPHGIPYADVEVDGVRLRIVNTHSQIAPSDACQVSASGGALNVPNPVGTPMATGRDFKGSRPRALPSGRPDTMDGAA